MGLAGDAAERKFSQRRRFGGHQDLSNAADLLDLHYRVRSESPKPVSTLLRSKPAISWICAGNRSQQ